MTRFFLEGCRTQPLGSYLKSLGIFRLLAEQKDPSAKACWEGSSFCIYSQMTEETLLSFFLEEYEPTPIIAPWNGGSGFYPGDKTDGIDSILNSRTERLGNYREVIRTIRSWKELPSVPENADGITEMLQKMIDNLSPGKRKDQLNNLVAEIIASSSIEVLNRKNVKALPITELNQIKEKESDATRKSLAKLINALKKGRTECKNQSRSGKGKETILSICRNRLPDVALEWLDATYALDSQGNSMFNPLLGTGGNEGRLDFTNNFMQKVHEVLSSENSLMLLQSALWGYATPGLFFGKIGQYDPGKAGGFNQGNGIETKDFKINPWDFVMMIEGSLFLASSIVRRSPSDQRGFLSSPFTVSFTSAGFASSEYSEKGRAEIWLPCWRRLTGYSELRYIFSEGRSLVNRKRAKTGMDFSRAISTLGVDRGISSFERYAFIERRGQSYVAIPSGSYPVHYQKDVEYLRELDPILSQLDSLIRRLPSTPATLGRARRNIEQSMFRCTMNSSPENFQQLVGWLGHVERFMAHHDMNSKESLSKPLVGLSPKWLSLCDDGQVEVRIAGALASIEISEVIGPIRTYLSGVSPSSPFQWDSKPNSHSWIGNSLQERLSSVFQRRIMDAQRHSVSEVPVKGRILLVPSDVMPYLFSETDDNLIEDLFWGFQHILWNRQGLGEVSKSWGSPIEERLISRTWAILKLLHSPFKVQGINIRMEPRILALLRAGRIKEACSVAANRLRVSGLNPRTSDFNESMESLRLLSSLMVPVRSMNGLEEMIFQS